MFATFVFPFSLKGEKISPVLVNHSTVGVLVELKRPPVISHTCYSKIDDEQVDTRMPGTPLIGHANAWLFELTDAHVGENYMKLFQILRRYNLSPRQFFEYNIIDLLYPLYNARKCLRHVQLLSN